MIGIREPREEEDKPIVPARDARGDDDDLLARFVPHATPLRLVLAATEYIPD
jgi:hypothetical protein